jgi:hypothetical protein
VISPEACGPEEDRARLHIDNDAPDFEDSEMDLSTLALGADDEGIDVHC